MPPESVPKTAQSKFDTERVIIDNGDGEGNPNRGKYPGSYGSGAPPIRPPFRTSGAVAGIRGQEQRKINRNARMGELARNTGFVETDHGE